MRSGRGDKFVEPWTGAHPLGNFHVTNLSSRPEVMGLRPTHGDENAFRSRNQLGPQAHDSSDRKTFPGVVRGTADPSASLLMTQGERTMGLVPRLRRSDSLRDRFPSPSGLG